MFGELCEGQRRPPYVGSKDVFPYTEISLPGLSRGLHSELVQS